VLSFQARFTGIALTDVSIIFVCGPLAVTGSRWEEVMGNECCAEPSLDELFRDPAMQVLLRRDGVTENDIWALLCTMKEARAVAMRVAERRPGAPKSAAHMPDRRETVISSRAARSPEAGEKRTGSHDLGTARDSPDPPDVHHDYFGLPGE